MQKGGYQIVDLKGTALTSGTEATIEGVYAALSNAGGKRTVVSGLKVGGTAYSDVEVLFTLSTTTYTGVLVIGATTITIVVANDDGVTATAVTAEG